LARAAKPLPVDGVSIAQVAIEQSCEQVCATT
jgi:hypothetical protein